MTSLRRPEDGRWGARWLKWLPASMWPQPGRAGDPHVVPASTLGDFFAGVSWAEDLGTSRRWRQADRARRDPAAAS